MKKPLLAAASLLAIAGVVVVLGLMFIHRMTPDAPLAGDADLKLEAAAAGPDDAYPDFELMTAKLQLTLAERELLGKQDESKTPDLAAVEPLIARNAEVLSLFGAFSRRMRFTLPNYSDPDKIREDTPVPPFSPVVSAAQLSSLRAGILLREGRAPEALEEALTIIEAGQVMLRSDQPIISAMVGLLLSNIGARRGREIVESGKLDLARLLDAAKRLSSHRGGAAAIQAGMRFEYRAITNTLDHLPENAAKMPGGRWYHPLMLRNRYFYQPQRTRALYTGRYRGFVEEAGKPCLLVRPPSPPQPHELAMVGANTFGRRRFYSAVPQLEKLYAHRCEMEFRVSALAASAALAAYRRDRKSWPASLGDLVPGYLPSVPTDPFTGEPLLYSPGTGEVHSAGKDSEGKAL